MEFKKITFANEEIARYDLLDLNDKHFHHHLVCINCNKVIEIKDDLLDALEVEIEKTYQFNILNHELIFNGICKECQVSDEDER